MFFVVVEISIIDCHLNGESLFKTQVDYNCKNSYKTLKKKFNLIKFRIRKAIAERLLTNQNLVIKPHTHT